MHLEKASALSKELDPVVVGGEPPPARSAGAGAGRGHAPRPRFLLLWVASSSVAPRVDLVAVPVNRPGGNTGQTAAVYRLLPPIGHPGAMDNPVPAALRLLRAPRRLGQRWGLRLPRRTVRLRLTALYGLLFLASGALLLVILNVAAHGWSNEDTRHVPPAGFGPPPPGWRPTPPNSRGSLHALQEWQKTAQERFA